MSDLPSPWLRSTEWLADHLNAPDLIIVDGSWYLPTDNRDAHAEYLASHIPGALHFDIDTVKDKESSLPHMLPRPEAFASAMRKMGIGDGASILVYDGPGFFSAPRVWWTFRVFGLERVFILDGGFAKWQAEGRPVEEGPVKRRETHFTARFNAGAVRDLTDVAKALQAGVQVVDARSAARFSGAAPEPRAGLESGHMPGALNVPWTELLQDGRLKSRDELSAIFKAAGVDPAKPTITTCGSGVSAAIVGMGLEAAGARDWMLYDGSWSEWGADPKTPKAKG